MRNELETALIAHETWLQTRHAAGTRADFANADLRGANFAGRDLRDAKFAGADLREANFAGADLVDADLRGAKLAGASFAGADLNCADLRGAEGADWTGANLGNAQVGLKLYSPLPSQLPSLPKTKSVPPLPNGVEFGMRNELPMVLEAYRRAGFPKLRYTSA